MDIFSYSDPGDYLSDAYQLLKMDSPGVSHRYIAKTLGFRSSAVFRLMMSGRITPSPETIDGLAKIFSLSTEEKDSDYIDYGAIVFDKHMLELISKNQKFSTKELWLLLSKNRQLATYEVFDRFYDIGEPKRLEEVRKLIMKIQ